MLSRNKHATYFFLRKFKMHNYECPRKFERQVGSFRVQLAQNPQDLVNSFQLRSKVFHEELRRQKNSMGMDISSLDAVADHLLFWNDRKSELIASVRLIQDPSEKHSPCQKEFYMDRVLDSDYRSKMEFGRLCVHPEYRNSFINAWIWTAIGEYCFMMGSDLLYGIASLRLRPNQEAARTYLQMIQQRHVALSYFSHPRPEYQMQKLDPWMHFLRQNTSSLETSFCEKIPPLLQSFLSAHGHIVSEPAWDPEFQCLDFLTMIPTQNLFRRFLGSQTRSLPSVPLTS